MEKWMTSNLAQVRWKNMAWAFAALCLQSWTSNMVLWLCPTVKCLCPLLLSVKISVGVEECIVYISINGWKTRMYKLSILVIFLRNRLSASKNKIQVHPMLFVFWKTGPLRGIWAFPYKQCCSSLLFKATPELQRWDLCSKHVLANE